MCKLNICSLLSSLLINVASLSYGAVGPGIPMPESFGNAEWIGAPGDRLPLYPDHLAVFRVDFDVAFPASDDGSESKVALVYGANDPRLMDANLNIYNLAGERDSIGVRLEIDCKGNLRLFRYGYHPDDSPSDPVAFFKADNMVPGSNHISVASNLGHTDIFVNGVKTGYCGLNPVGNGGDYLAFPVLGETALEIGEGSGAVVSGLTIRNFREPSNVLCRFPQVFTKSCRPEIPLRSMPELRRRFMCPTDVEIAGATLLATARGIYDVYVNGIRINEGYFSPGSTQYNRTHLYDEYDVTPFLRKGENELRVQLGEGWWCGPSTFVGENTNFFGDHPSFLGNLTVRYDDGASMVIATDADNWDCSVDGPVVEGSFFNGEIYDAMREGGKDRIWGKAMVIGLDSTVNHSVGRWDRINLRPGFGNGVHAVDTLVAVGMSEPRPGLYVYDMGQNMAGVPLIDFRLLREGQEVRMRYAEVLYPDLPPYSAHKGMIMTENLRAAMCTDRFRSAGKLKETFSPRFTFHGYRYIEVSGVDSPLPLEAVRAVPLSSIRGVKAHYECSDSLVNRLWRNMIWSSLSNFISIPTDCPQRNERLGWMGDISVFSPTAVKIADLSALLRQYITSIRDCQSDNGKYPDVAPTDFGFGGLLWGSAGIVVPWECWRQYGDLSLLEEHYPSMRRYIDYILRETIDPPTGIIVQQRAWGDLGDWLSPEYDKADKSLLWECYFIYDLGIMSDVARALGKSDDASEYEELRLQRIAFFKDTYIDPVTEKTRHSMFDPERFGTEIDTQVSYALPIAMGIYESPLFTENFLNTVTRENRADNGAVCPPYSLMTGFIGTAWIGEALSRCGHSETAYRLLTSTDYPSWLYPVTQGATTVWERLDSYTHKDGFGSNNSMNSFNHYSFGAVGNWLLTRSLGIVRDAGGEVIVAPEPDPTGRINHASGWIEYPEGKVMSSWKILSDEVEYTVEVPEGVTGRIKLPDGSEKPLHPGLNRFTSLSPVRAALAL